MALLLEVERRIDKKQSCFVLTSMNIGYHQSLIVGHRHSDVQLIVSGGYIDHATSDVQVLSLKVNLLSRFVFSYDVFNCKQPICR
jgi:hypothetical protein